MASLFDFLGYGAPPGESGGSDLGGILSFLTPSGMPPAQGAFNLSPALGGMPPSPSPQGYEGGMPSVQQPLPPNPTAPDPWAGVRPMSASDLGIPSAQPGAPAMAPPMNILPDAVRGSTVDASGTRSFAPSGPDNRSWNDVAGRLFDFFNSPDAPRMLMAMAGGFGGARSLGEGLGRAASNTAAVMSRLDKLDAPQLKQIDTDRQGQPIFAWVNPRTQHITPIAGR